MPKLLNDSARNKEKEQMHTTGLTSADKVTLVIHKLPLLLPNDFNRLLDAIIEEDLRRNSKDWEDVDE